MISIWRAVSDRIAVVASCRYVDRVIPDAPTCPTPSFLDSHGIDVVVHGGDYSQAEIETYYGAILRTHRLIVVPYTPGISTSDIINRILDRASMG